MRRYLCNDVLLFCVFKSSCYRVTKLGKQAVSLRAGARIPIMGQPADYGQRCIDTYISQMRISKTLKDAYKKNNSFPSFHFLKRQGE